MSSLWLEGICWKTAAFVRSLVLATSVSRFVTKSITAMTIPEIQLFSIQLFILFDYFEMVMMMGIIRNCVTVGLVSGEISKSSISNVGLYFFKYQGRTLDHFKLIKLANKTRWCAELLRQCSCYRTSCYGILDTWPETKQLSVGAFMHCRRGHPMNKLFMLRYLIAGSRGEMYFFFHVPLSHGSPRCWRPAAQKTRHPGYQMMLTGWNRVCLCIGDGVLPLVLSRVISFNE